MTIFSIQVGAPILTGASADDAETLTAVVEDLFRHETEDAYLNWNGVRVALNYKYDVSTILPDMVSMLGELLSHPAGSSVVEWTSSSFSGTWRLSWAAGRIKIRPEWRRVTGNVEPILTAVGSVDMPLSAFVAEWMELVRLLARCFERLELLPEIEGLAEFKEVARAAEGAERGLLYRPST